MIINNACNQKGDVLFFETTPIWGMMRQFSSFSDDISGETDKRFFDKKFRYSFDGGIVYSDWYALNNENISSVWDNWIDDNSNKLSVTLDEKSDFKLQFRYERKGSDNTGEISLNNITINGRYLYKDVEYVAVNDSIFKGIIDNNVDLFDLVMNLTDKMYNSGIVAEYVERKNEDEKTLLQDRDYIDYWKTVSEFYSMIFMYALRFSNIYWKKELLAEYLLQKGIILCDVDDIIEMQNITQNFYNEIKSRGTLEIFRPKGFQYQSQRRKAYQAPSGYSISSKNYCIIDGVQYNSENRLPFGWSYDSTNYQLISNDLNYHSIIFNLFIDGDNTSYSPSKIYIKESEEFSDIIKKYDGEYLRLICYNSYKDEFMYEIVNLKDFGWNVNNSSPMYKGLDDHYGSNIVKAYEVSKNFVKLSKYPWFDQSSISIVDDEFQPEYCTPVMKVKATVT